MKASHLSCVLAALLPLLGWAQGAPGPMRRPPPVAPPAVRPPAIPPPPAAPLSPAAREGLQLAEQGCQSDGYEPELCERAIRQLEAAARESPSQLEVQLALAQAYWNRSFQERSGSRARQSWQQRSMDIYHQLVDQRVRDARPYYEMSIRTKDEGQRTEMLRRTVELDPRHPRAHQDLAWGLLKQGRPDEAWQQYERHMEVSPVRDRQEAQESLRFADAMARARRPQQGAQVVEEVMKQMKDERRAERCLLLQSADPRLAEARPTVRRELEKLRPYCTDTEHLDQAVELEQQGRVDEAVTALERQVATNPKPEETYVMLERLYLRKGQPEKAAEVTARSLREEPDARARCERFRRLSPRTLRAMEAQALESLRRQCSQP